MQPHKITQKTCIKTILIAISCYITILFQPSYALPKKVVEPYLLEIQHHHAGIEIAEIVFSVKVPLILPGGKRKIVN